MGQLLNRRSKTEFQAEVALEARLEALAETHPSLRLLYHWEAAEVVVEAEHRMNLGEKARR